MAGKQPKWVGVDFRYHFAPGCDGVARGLGRNWVWLFTGYGYEVHGKARSGKEAKLKSRRTFERLSKQRARIDEIKKGLR